MGAACGTPPAVTSETARKLSPRPGPPEPYDWPRGQRTGHLAAVYIAIYIAGYITMPPSTTSTWPVM